MNQLAPVECYSYEDCVLKAGAIIAAYPKLFLEDEAGFQGTIAFVLMNYPKAVVDQAVHQIPTTIPKTKLEPYSVREFCKEAAQPFHAERKWQQEQQAQDRKDVALFHQLERERRDFEVWQQQNPGKSRFDYLGIKWRPGISQTAKPTPYVETEWGQHSQAVQDSEAEGTIARSLGIEAGGNYKQ